MNHREKKKQQLGMDPGTASYKLTKDLLFSFICETGKNYCHHCGLPMTRENFSIEHIEPWLDSEDPSGLFFDLDNISYSHHSCNCAAARQQQAKHGSTAKYQKGCRCDPCKEAWAAQYKKWYTPEKRRERYLRTKR